MKNKLILLFSSLCLSFWQVNSYAQSNEVINNFATIIQKGDTKELIKTLGENVEINIDGNRQTLNKLKTEEIIRNFINQHPLSKFEYMHKGSNGSSAYAIAKYASKAEVYRVLLKTDGNLIEKIDFTKE
jgi:hypothetical protein